MSELQGAALDWAVAQVIINSGEFTTDGEEHGTGRPYFNCKNGEPCLWGAGAQAIGTMNAKTGKPWVMHGSGGYYSPSTEWSDGGPLIKKYNVMLSPPSSAVHRNYGYMDKRNGYEEAGFWGTTIFAKERKHRRAAFHHKDDPLIPAMQAIVQFELGDVVQIPEELVN